MSDENRSTTPRLRLRYVLDLDGGDCWMVEEREFHGDRSLFFVRDGRFVRQRSFPDDWFELPDAEVLALLPSASPARVSPRYAPGGPPGAAGVASGSCTFGCSFSA